MGDRPKDEYDSRRDVAVLDQGVVLRLGESFAQCNDTERQTEIV